MIRRMKIKASPNLFGGSKKGNAPAKKVKIASANEAEGEPGCSGELSKTTLIEPELKDNETKTLTQVATDNSQPFKTEPLKPIQTELIKLITSEPLEIIEVEPIQPVATETLKLVPMETVKSIAREFLKPITTELSKPVAPESSKLIATETLEAPPSLKQGETDSLKPIENQYLKPVTTKPVKPVVIESLNSTEPLKSVSKDSSTPVSIEVSTSVATEPLKPDEIESSKSVATKPFDFIKPISKKRKSVDQSDSDDISVIISDEIEEILVSKKECKKVSIQQSIEFVPNLNPSSNTEVSIIELPGNLPDLNQSLSKLTDPKPSLNRELSGSGLTDNLQNMPLSHPEEEVTVILPGKDTLHAVENSSLVNKDAEESSTLLSQSEPQNIISQSNIFKNRVASKPPVNLNSLNKIPARRTRIKGRPIIPVIKRPPTSAPSKLKESLNDVNKTVLENKTENKMNNEITEPLVQNQNEKEDQGSNFPITSSKLDMRQRIESKENIDKGKYKDEELKENKKGKYKVEESKENIDKRKHKETNTQNKNSTRPMLDIAITPEEVKQKKIFYERKQKYRKKLSTATGNLEKSQMTMFDLIFWNPATNPMPGMAETERVRSRSNSLTEPDANNVHESLEEQRVEEEGLQIITPNSPNAKPSSTPSVSDLDQKEKKSTKDSDVEEEEASTLAPQVKIGPNGELIIDEKSLVIQTTAAKNRDEILSRTEVVEESNESSHYGKWSKRRKRSTEWTRKETARFYKALSTVGTDFSLMETIFAWRSRSELKIKFKKEERVNRHLIDTALNDCTQFDFSIFDESDYDPDEDRKETKEAEKAEAKRKREVEREKRKVTKEREKIIKKEQKKEEKKRKKKLRNVNKKLKRKKKVSGKPADGGGSAAAVVAAASKSTTVAASKTTTVAAGVRGNNKRLKRTHLKRKNSVIFEEVICELVFSSPEKDKFVERNYTKKEDEIPPVAVDPLSLEGFEMESKEVEGRGHSSCPVVPVVEVDGEERLIVSPRLGSDACVSSSCFSVEDSSSHRPSSVEPMSVSVHADHETRNEPISIYTSSIPMSRGTDIEPMSVDTKSGTNTDLITISSLPMSVDTDDKNIEPITISTSGIPIPIEDNIHPSSKPISISTIPASFDSEIYSNLHTKHSSSRTCLTNSTITSSNSEVTANDSAVASNNSIVTSHNSEVTSHNSEISSNDSAGTSNNSSKISSNDSTVTLNDSAVTSNNSAVPSSNSAVTSNNTSQLRTDHPVVQYFCPISVVQRSSEGENFVEINTEKGIKKIGVPPLSPLTSSVVVMATKDPQNEGEHIYHVYTVAPLEGGYQETSPQEPHQHHDSNPGTSQVQTNSLMDQRGQNS